VTVFSPFGNTISEVRTALTLSGKTAAIDYDIFHKDTLEETIRTTLEYDATDHLICLKEAVGTDEEVSTRKSYDIYGRCVEETHPSGTLIQHSYDGKGRLIRKKSSDETVDFSFSYTFHDLVEKAYDHIEKTETRRTYDGFGHMVKEVQSNGLRVHYEYSSEGRLEKITLPDHSEVHYHYDGGALSQAERINGSSSYSFCITKRSASGMVLETEAPFSLGPISYAYDRMGRPISKTHALCSDTRTYDLLGRTTVRSIDGVQETFQYDDLSQLISDNGRPRSYDSYYRLREKEGETLSVTRRQQCTALGKKHFSYDKDGRRIKDGLARLEYDALGHLRSYRKEGMCETYEYDGFSRRMKKKSEGTEALYLWVGLHEVGTFTPTGSCLSFRMVAEGVGTEGEATLAVELEGTPYCALSDLSGNIRALLSSSGEVVHTAHYSSFDRIETTGISCPWGFFSKRHDELTGYVHFLHRLYDPTTSSFITQDPLGLEGGPNLYAYVKNNPLSLFDLLGLWDNETSWGSNDLGSASSAQGCDYGSYGCSNNSWDNGSSWGSNNLSSEGYSCSFYDSVCGPPTSPPEGAGAFAVGGGLISVYAGTFYPTDCFSSRYGHDFQSCFRAGQPNEKGIVYALIFDNGINTTKHEAIGTSNQMRAIEESKDKKPYCDVMNMYIETHGIVIDVFRAIMSFFCVTDLDKRIADLYEGLIKEAQKFQASTGNTVVFDNALHSRGGVNFANVRSELLRRNPSYQDFLGQTVTFGSTVTFEGSCNYWAKGDPVPAMNPFNIPNLFLYQEDIRTIDYSWQSPQRAHAMLGPAYLQAFSEFIDHRSEGL